MRYKRRFRLNPSDIDVIESCLSKELANRSQAFLDSAKQEDPQAMNEASSGIAEITELLGKIHNQKSWFGRDPKNRAVPMG